MSFACAVIGALPPDENLIGTKDVNVLHIAKTYGDGYTGEMLLSRDEAIALRDFLLCQENL